MSEPHESIELHLKVTDRETVDALNLKPEGAERNEYALAALKVGVFAMHQIRGDLDAKTIRDEGEAILKRVEQALGAHEKTVQDKIVSTLSMYFDPTSGQFSERVKRLIESGGDLERVILAQVEGESSALGQMLSRTVGVASPLMQALDPAAKDGIIERLRKAVDDLNAENRKQILGQFDLNDPASALAKFVSQAQQQNKTLEEALRTKVDDLAKLLSLDVENSAMSRVKQTLLDALKSAESANNAFREKVLLALQELKIRKEEGEKTTTHGLEFEDAVVEAAVRYANEYNDVAQKTGATTGVIKNCKIGDAVITIGPDDKLSGSRIVVEAKESIAYDLNKALEEMDTALKNRQSTAGVFVSSKRTSSPTIPILKRYDKIVIVQWDPESPETEPFLKAAFSIARFIATARNVSADGQVDADELEKCIRAIEKKAGKLDDIMTSAETIRSGTSKIIDAARILKDELLAQISNLNDWENKYRATL